MSDLEKAVGEMVKAYRRAVWERDVEAFLRLYGPDVRVFDAWGTWFYDGAAAWRTMIEAWFSSISDQAVRVTFDAVRIFGGEGLAGVSAIVTYADVSPDGRELKAMQNRLSWTLKGEAGSWRIVHEHTSVPVRFEEGKGILRQEEVP